MENLQNQFEALNIELTNEDKEALRASNVSYLLKKVSLGQALEESEKIDLRNDVKTVDLKDRILLVKKGGVKFMVSYSDHVFSFLTKGLTTSSKRYPLQLLSLNFGTCQRYLESLGFEMDFESTKSEYSKLIASEASVIAQTRTEQQISDIKTEAKFVVKLFNKALKTFDLNDSLKTGIAYGTASASVLAKFAEAEAKKAKAEAEAKAKAEAKAEAKAKAEAELIVKTETAEAKAEAKAEALAKAKERAEELRKNYAEAKKAKAEAEALAKAKK